MRGIGRRQLSFKSRITIMVLAGSLLLFFILGIITYFRVGELMVNQCKESSMSLARTISRELDGDVVDRVASEADPEYSTILQTLKKYEDYSGVKYIYVMKLDDDGKLRFVVDADLEDPAACLEEYPWVPDMAPAFGGYVCTDEKPITDEWGSCLSAYAPIFRSNGHVAAIVGIDVSVDDINKYMNSLMGIILTIVVVSIVVVVITYLLISRNLTERDMLTDLPNNQSLLRQGERLSKKGRMSDYTACIINIKGFTYINKRYGYDRGNYILVDMARALGTLIRGGEILARLGNDSFIILVHNSRTETFLNTLERINPGSSEEVTKDTLPASVRCGVYRAQDEDSIEQVVSLCTLALNHGRTEKGGDIVYYSDDMYDDVLKDGDVVTSFNRAISNREFRVFYQPKVDIVTGRLCGAEALVRWKKDDVFISPGVFIPILESKGLITKLDMYVFDRVCEDIERWKAEGLQPVMISSNFSKLHLNDKNFADSVIALADKRHTEHKYLCVELTESSGYGDTRVLVDFVARMKREGIGTSMDDFGTGYSSLSLLGDLEMDEVKIDKSFVDRIFNDTEQGAKLVRNVVRMILDLGRDVICEGVETRNQLEFLREAGCTKIQGYYFDRPLECAEFEKRLKDPVYRKQAEAN